MSRQTNRGGMGSHKHGISGHSHRSARNKQEVARLVNEATDDATRKRRARGKTEQHDSVRDLFKRR